jgi:molybdopterin-guanine dinucleotide biosynthesis protein A
MNGRIKCTLPVGNRSILARQLEALRAAGIDHVMLIGRWLVDEPPPAPIVADAMDATGSLGGVYTALLCAVTDPVVVLAGDMPFVNVPLIRRLCDLGQETDATVPRSPDGLHPLCAGYRRRIATQLKRRLDRLALSVRAALEDVAVDEVGAGELGVLDPAGLALMNVNTPEDYERACARARAL